MHKQRVGSPSFVTACILIFLLLKAHVYVYLTSQVQPLLFEWIPASQPTYILFCFLAKEEKSCGKLSLTLSFLSLSHTKLYEWITLWKKSQLMLLCHIVFERDTHTQVFWLNHSVAYAFKRLYIAFPLEFWSDSFHGQTLQSLVSLSHQLLQILGHAFSVC